MVATPAPNPERIRELAARTRFTDEGVGPGGVGPRGGITCVGSTGSTNADMADFVRAGGTGFRVLVADHQDQGRGRFARRWQDTPGTSLALSVLVPTDRPAADWGWLSMVAGLAVTRAVEETTGAERGRVVLKWPNDVLLDTDRDHGGKVCGILCERVDGPAGPHAVLGMGLNVSAEGDELPVPTATSLRCCGLPHDKDVLVAALVRHLDGLLDQWLGTGTVRQDYRARCDTVGARVRLTFDTAGRGIAGAPAPVQGERVVEGVAVDVSADGALVVRDEAGDHVFPAADVTHLRPR